MAVSLDTNVPWIMCKQDDAPDPLVSKPKSLFRWKSLIALTEFSLTLCSAFINYRDNYAHIFFWNDRLILVTTSTVQNTHLTSRINPKCGQNSGLAGKLHDYNLFYTLNTCVWRILEIDTKNLNIISQVICRRSLPSLYHVISNSFSTVHTFISTLYNSNMLVNISFT